MRYVAGFRASHRVSAAMVTVLGVLLAGCAGAPADRAVPPSAAPTPTVRELQPTAAPTVRPAPDPATAEGQADHVFEIFGGPDYLAATADAVWVKSDDGSLDRIDPQTNTITASVEVSDSLCQGLGAGPRSVWTCTTGGVVRVDPVTNEVVASVDVDKSTFQGQIGVGFGHAWVLDGEGTTLLGVSESTNAVALRVPLGTPCVDVAVSARKVWVSCGVDDVVLGIDPDRSEVVTRVRRLEEVRAITATAHAVWVGYAEGVARIDAATGEVTARAVLDVTDQTRMTASAGDVWIRRPAPFLSRLDATSLEVRDDIESAAAASSGSVLVAFGSVWASAYDDALVYRLTP